MYELDDPTIAALARANYQEFAREMARWSGAAGALEERNGVLLYATATDFPVTCNGVLRLDDSVAPDQVLDIAAAWFGALDRGFTLNLRAEDEGDAALEAAAEARGLVLVGNSPVMICRERPAPRDVPAGIELRWVRDGAAVQDFIDVNDAAYQSLGMPAGVIATACAAPERLLAPHVHAVVAYDGDQPSAAAAVLLSHGIAGVYYVGTVDAARGRGLADAATRAVTRRAFDLGAGAVCLQATAMGEPVYLRMGYEEIGRYHGLVSFR